MTLIDVRTIDKSPYPTRYRDHYEITARNNRGPDHTGLQLHVIAHSQKQNPSNLSPYETAMHFMWDDVQWWKCLEYYPFRT
jgi:hypothetical protein